MSPVLKYLEAAVPRGGLVHRSGTANDKIRIQVANVFGHILTTGKALASKARARKVKRRVKGKAFPSHDTFHG